MDPKWYEKYSAEIAEKWLHALKCNPCTARWSTIQFLKGMTLSDWRVTATEFLKSIAQTAELTGLFPDDFVMPPEGQPVKVRYRCIRNIFGIDFNIEKYN